jgi:inner membrane protein
MIGAVLPDVDMLYFFFVDNGMTHHHTYVTHRPAVWAALLGLSLLLRRHPVTRPIWAMSLGGLLHMVLDSVVGAIDWEWPFFVWGIPLVTVPATFDWWVMSFLAHWTFGIEVLICLTAAACLRKRKVHMMCTSPDHANTP